MSWRVELDEDFSTWLDELTPKERTAILGAVLLLQERGPNLGRPYVDGVKGSSYANMKELRVQVAGKPWRILFAFDPQRSAFLLIGGNKGGDSRWYKTNLPIADERFKRHLDNLEE